MASLQRASAYQPLFSGDTAIEQYGQRKECYCVPVTIAIILHALALYFILQGTRTVLVAPKVKGEQVAMLYFPPGPKPAPPKPPKARPQVRPAPVPQPRAPQTITARSVHAPAYMPPPVNAPTITITTPPPEEDMMARVEAARKRRNQQNPELAQAAPPEPAEDENQRAIRIAKANFASAQKRGNDKEDNGGIFEIKNQSYHTAEFTFRGWNGTMRRMWPQLYTVEQGQENDIETAIIKKMIEVIRKDHDSDFVWESHRLGRNITLSARLADTAQLQQFLLREFFPHYRQSGG